MTEHVSLHYSEAGQGMPVILLHGFPLSSAIWESQRTSLSDHYRVITPDLRGHGHSPVPPEGYEMESLAGDVLSLLDTLRIDKAAIFGHSMGGYVALAAWKRAPDRFLALGMVASQAAADSDEARQARFKLIEKVDAEGSRVAAAAMIPKLFGPGVATGDPMIEQVRQMIVTTPVIAITGSLRGMAARPDSGEALSKIDKPVLILAGEKDQIIPTARAEAMAAAAPNAKLVVIENSGHMPMLERPDATTSAIREFLGTLGG